GYNINDVMFYWTRGNESVSGLDTLQLAQYTVEDHYTSVSEAVYETGHYPRLVFHFELKRSILYFILETYVPSSLLVVLSWVSFWISLSSVPARICIGSWGRWCLFQEVYGREAVYTLDKLPVHCRATQRHTEQTTRHTPFTPRGNLERPINRTVMFLDCGRKPKYPERTHHVWGEHADSMQKDSPAGSRIHDLLAARQQCYQLHHCASPEWS
ncbi:hypothetical protein ATANTOWER_016754, partial [Ataeniobius toweri]|nr:hypothetical protein [Ataeniobius toweri]